MWVKWLPNAEPAAETPIDAGTSERDAESEDRALRRTLLFCVLPSWMAAGSIDWYCHKRSDIEHTAGTHESLTHALMLGSLGIPLTAALLFDVNALVIAGMLGGCIVHESITIWDVAYASGRRSVSNLEQHTHSFLEVMPFAAAALTVCLKPKQFAALFGRGVERARWRIEAKRPALPAIYVASILGAAIAFLALPYAEEFVRCYRVDRTLLPHRSDES